MSALLWCSGGDRGRGVPQDVPKPLRQPRSRRRPPRRRRRIACCPGRDHPVEAGDEVVVFGTPDELERSGVGIVRHRTAPSSVSVALYLKRRARAVMRSNSKGLVLAIAALAVLLVVAVAVIRTTYVDPTTHAHLSIVTSTYFVVETVATVGFGDFSFGGQSIGLQVFAIAFIAVGVTLLTLSFALFTNFLVGRRIDQTLGRRQVPGMAGHVVVIGLGSVGIRVVEGLLAEGRRVVVIESDEANRYLARARALGVPVVIADATQRQTHATVNLGDASAVAILTSADLTNIEAGLAVRESLGERWDHVPVVFASLTATWRG